MSRYSSRPALLAVVVFLSGCSDPLPERTPRPAHRDLDALSQQRSKVPEAIRNGYLAKAKYDDEARVWVGPKWRELDREQQIDLLDLIIADCYLVPKGSVILSNEKVLIFDGETQIGQYGINGLDLN